jgi:hypothetical protein
MESQGGEAPLPLVVDRSFPASLSRGRTCSAASQEHEEKGSGLSVDDGLEMHLWNNHRAWRMCRVANDMNSTNITSLIATTMRAGIEMIVRKFPGP